MKGIIVLVMAMCLVAVSAFGLDIGAVGGIGIDTIGTVVSGFFIFAPYLLPPVMAAKINVIKIVALFVVNAMDRAEKTKAGLSLKRETK
jgi:uncharacterized membrane protein